MDLRIKIKAACAEIEASLSTIMRGPRPGIRLLAKKGGLPSIKLGRPRDARSAF